MILVFFSQYHQQQERIFVERLFYLVLNNVELNNFSTFNINSIIHISKELEKYQRSTNKIILHTGKLNTIIQFVLSFSTTTIATFHLNNLFYLLLNDMNDFSGKIIDRIAELLRIYHSMTYGHSITKQYLTATVRQLDLLVTRNLVSRNFRPGLSARSEFPVIFRPGPNFRCFFGPA
jgi:hypothetical protein